MRIPSGSLKRRIAVLGLAVLIIVGLGTSATKENHGLVFTGSFSGPTLIYKADIFSRVSRNPCELELTTEQRKEFISLKQTYREKSLKIDARMAKVAEKLDEHWNSKNFDLEEAKAKVALLT